MLSLKHFPTTISITYLFTANGNEILKDKGTAIQHVIACYLNLWYRKEQNQFEAL